MHSNTPAIETSVFVRNRHLVVEFGFARHSIVLGRGHMAGPLVRGVA